MPSATRKAKSRTLRPDRRERTERRVLDAAERLLEGGAGFADISVETLISEAGISRSTFYAHFSDKPDLVRRLAREVTGELGAAASEWWDVAERANRDDLQHALRGVLDVYSRHEPVFRALMGTAANDESIAGEYHALIMALVDQAAAVIRRAQRAGVMRPVAARETAASITWMVERAAFQLLDTEVAPAKLTAALTEIVWQTLYGHSDG